MHALLAVLRKLCAAPVYTSDWAFARAQATTTLVLAIAVSLVLLAGAPGLHHHNVRPMIVTPAAPAVAR